jgi:tRNA (guanine26-N2/guanine27-N2)-dimethyltransferase
VFYNPAMAMDRDLGVAFVRTWFRGRSAAPTGWEMTAATGVRGLRLLEEGVPFAGFTFTETNPTALGVLEANAIGRPGVRVLAADARQPLGLGPFDYVDLDPYGTPAPFVRTAVGAVRTGGVLAVTATDMMVLAGAQPSACERRYGGRPLRGRLGPEGGLRILLAYLSSEARAAHRSIRPLVSYVRDHHVRAYLEVGAGAGPDPPVGAVDPFTWKGPYLGDHGPYGPFWLGPLLDAELVRDLTVPPTADRPEEVRPFLERLTEESAVDVPFYYEANRLAKALDLARPPSLADILRELRALGYRAARTHVRPEGFRTDAPRGTVERAVRRLSGAR